MEESRKESYEEPLVKAHDPLTDITAQVGTAKGKDVKEEKEREKDIKEIDKNAKEIDKLNAEKIDTEVPG